MSLILGIDPGFTGALALLEPDTMFLNVVDMPTGKDKSGRTVLNYPLLGSLLDPSGATVTCVLEYVAARPGQSAPATFRFGQGYGALQMAIAIHGIPVQYVTPAKWKKHFGLSRDKGVSRSYASERFPNHKEYFTRVKDDGRAEAALIALYAHEKLVT